MAMAKAKRRRRRSHETVLYGWMLTLALRTKWTNVQKLYQRHTPCFGLTH
jgi:hypothetical protein